MLLLGNLENAYNRFSRDIKSSLFLKKRRHIRIKFHYVWTLSEFFNFEGSKTCSNWERCKRINKDIQHKAVLSLKSVKCPHRRRLTAIQLLPNPLYFQALLIWIYRLLVRYVWLVVAYITMNMEPKRW